ncbi:hypothetical protein TNCV_2439401 [Trichonephila clavipes]|nr:hypothetical protein TNCV_2439401 [Trichonephila clavipes]
MPKLWRWSSVVSPSIIPLGISPSLFVLSHVWCSRPRPTTGVLLAPCHDEFRGPRSDYVRQRERGVSEYYSVALFSYTRAFGDGPHNREPWSSDEDDTGASIPSPNYPPHPTGRIERERKKKEERKKEEGKDKERKTEGKGERKREEKDREKEGQRENEKEKEHKKERKIRKERGKETRKSLVYADKPQTLDHLEDNIRRVIADIRPQMLEKVIENWTSRLDYIRASHGSHMPEIIFKM